MKNILSILLICPSVLSMELHRYKGPERIDIKELLISPEHVRAPEDLQPIEVYHDHMGFHVYRFNRTRRYHISRYNTDKVLLNLDRQQLNAFMLKGFFIIDRTITDDYLIMAKMY